MDLAEERLRQYCDDRLAEPRAEVPVPLQEVNIDAAQEQAAMVNTIPKIPQAAAGSGPTYVGVQDPAALRSPQRSNRSLSKASSPCLLNDCASNRSSPASSLYRRQSSDLATESLPALPPTETPRQLLPQQVEDTLDISFGLGTQGHEAEAARAAPSSPAEKPPAEPAEVVTVAQMEKPSAEPEVSEDPWEEILGSLAEVAPPRVSKADVWTKESSGDAECNFNSTLESSKEKEVEVEVEDEAEVSLQKPAESLEVKAEERVVTSPTHLSEVKPDVHVDAPLAKPPEVEELHSELSEAETPAQKSATESPEVKVEGFPTDLSEVKPGTQVDGPLAEPPEAMVQTEVEELHSELSEAEMPAQKLATESPEAKADMQVVRSPTDVSEVDMLLAEPPEALVQTEVEKLHSELSEAEMPAQKPATESPEVKADMQVVRSPTDVSEVDMPLAEPPEALVPTEVEELHSELSEAEMPAQKPATESPEADIHFEKQSAESSKDPWDEILGNLANAPQSASKTEAKCIDSSGDEEESYSDSEYESYEEDEEEEEEQVTERVDAGIVLVDMDSGSSSVESRAFN
ncbi:unnamed protein product [Durusdinium trenchii]|uniref:Uncharacterized protein n=1 Tax=Durusdinium trenchii TaxID=1381693 RepID=A0ABP0K598_9DINO